MQTPRIPTVTYPLLASLLCALLSTIGCDSESTDPNSTSDGGSGGAGGSTALPDPVPLKVVTWNVHNFVDNTNDGAQFEDQDPGWLTHLADIGRVLKSIDADVVMLQEVEHEAIVSKLNTDELAGVYAHRRVIDANDPRGIDVGVMSKIAFDDVISHKDDSFVKEGTNGPNYKYSRDAVEVHITFNGRPLVLINVHYKAKDNDDPDKRLAEAQRTRAIADEITAAAPETGVLILGDFNDTPGSPPYTSTVGEAPDQYTNAADSVAAADRWTYTYYGNQELVDHQMSNPLLRDRLNTASVQILHGPEVEAASDHAPLIAVYNVN